MTPQNLALVLASTLVHVFANTAFKSSRHPTVFAWGMLAAAVILFSPLWAYAHFNWIILGIVALSGLLDALYFLSMSRAYAKTDLSVAYPLARGTAPLLLSVWATVFLAERPSPAGFLGIGLIAAGLYTVNLTDAKDWRRPLRSLKEAGPRWALLAGLFISLYTALDKYGLSVTRLAPMAYTYQTLVWTVIWMTPGVLALHRWKEVWGEWRIHWPRLALAGVATLAAYGLVLIAVSRGAPVSYAGAVREFSVVLGAVVGWRFLGESRGIPRVLGASLVALGVAVIAVAG